MNHDHYDKVKAVLDDWEYEAYHYDPRDPDTWAELDYALIEAQYSYIRLGLILEKIRNHCYWKYCQEKFSSFKDWVLAKTRLTCWQANSYIEAANIARYLIGSGNKIIPANCSQAAALIPAYNQEIGYYQDRPILERVWEQACELPSITASAIKAIINPNRQVNAQKVSKSTFDRASRLGAAAGMTGEEYLNSLMDAAEEPEEGVLVPGPAIDLTPEEEECLDQLDRQFRQSAILFDRLTSAAAKKVDDLSERIFNVVGDINWGTPGVKPDYG